MLRGLGGYGDIYMFPLEKRYKRYKRYNRCGARDLSVTPTVTRQAEALQNGQISEREERCT